MEYFVIAVLTGTRRRVRVGGRAKCQITRRERSQIQPDGMDGFIS